MSKVFDTVESASGESGFKRGDTVRMFKEDKKLKYPCMILTCEKLESFRVQALKGLLGTKTLLDDGSSYALYINFKNQLIEIGNLPSTNLKSLLGNKVFNMFDKQVLIDKDTSYTGEMLFALCLTQNTL